MFSGSLTYVPEYLAEVNYEGQDFWGFHTYTAPHVNIVIIHTTTLYSIHFTKDGSLALNQVAVAVAIFESNKAHFVCPLSHQILC